MKYSGSGAAETGYAAGGSESPGLNVEKVTICAVHKASTNGNSSRARVFGTTVDITSTSHLATSCLVTAGSTSIPGT